MFEARFWFIGPNDHDFNPLTTSITHHVETSQKIWDTCTCINHGYSFLHARHAR